MKTQTPVIPATLHALMSMRRPHGGTGEAAAQALVIAEAQRCKAARSVVKDVHGNIEVLVGNHPELVFTAHLDTVHRNDGLQKLFFIEDSSLVVADGPDGKASVLGADDAAGVYLLLEMIKAGKHGRYLFFVGEECGGIGSSAYVKDNPTFSANMVVSFDRKGTTDIITHQSWTCTASNTFASALATQLNLYGKGFKYTPSDEGLYTDSKEFSGIVPECTNISVGYYKEHTIQEHLDLDHLLKLKNALLQIDWTKLPCARVPEPDVPWMPTFNGTSLGKTWHTRAEAVEAIAMLRLAGKEGDLSDVELNHYLNIIEGYIQ